MKVELVKMRTILELTGGKVPREPQKMRSTVWSSIVDASGTNWNDGPSHCVGRLIMYAQHRVERNTRCTCSGLLSKLPGATALVAQPLPSWIVHGASTKQSTPGSGDVTDVE